MCKGFRCDIKRRFVYMCAHFFLKYLRKKINNMENIKLCVSLQKKIEQFRYENE